MKAFIGFFFFLTISVFSQEKMPLKSALIKIEEREKITFSYSEQEIQKFQNITYNSTLSFDKLMLSFALQTQLVFEKLDDRHYIIRKKNKASRSICGTVINKETNQPVPFITLFYGSKAVTTDEEGIFVIQKILKDDLLTTNSLQYETLTLAVADFKKDCKTIYVKEKVNSLSEITISNYLTKGFTKEKEGSIALNPKKMGILPGVIEPDVLQSLQLIPGVQSPDETASGLHIRGSTPDQNLVIFDGMKMYHFSHFFGLISAFNPYITNSIKLFRSGTHAKYGNNVGGVLDIGMDVNVPTKFSAGLGSTFTHSDVYIKTPIIKNKLGVVFSARRSITDVFNSITYQKYSDVAFQNSRISEGLSEDNFRISNAQNNFFYEDYYSKLIFQPNSKHTFSVGYLYNLNDLAFTGTTQRFREDFNDKIEIENKGFKADWKYKNNAKGNHKIVFSSTEFYKDYVGSRTVTQRNNQTTNSLFTKNNGLNETNIDYQFEKQTAKGNSLQFGYQYSKYNVDYYFTRDVPNENNNINDGIDRTETNNALFFEYQLKNKKRWLVNFGVRWQNFGANGKNFIEPRLHVNYKTKNKLNIKLSSELKHQSISQVVDFRNDGLGGLFDRFWVLSDGDKFPFLDSFQTSLGIDYQKNGWSLDAEVYYKHIDGVLFLLDLNNRNTRYYAGDNTVVGFDFLVKKQIQNYNTWISYSLSKSRYQFDELNNGNEFDGSFDAPHNFIWSHNYRLKAFDFSLGWRFRSGIPYTLKEGELNNANRMQIKYDDLNTKRLPNYQRVDFSATYQFLVNKEKMISGKLGLTLQNLMNRRSVLFRDYELRTILEGQGPNANESQVLIEVDRLSMGFVPNLMFRLEF